MPRVTRQGSSSTVFSPSSRLRPRRTSACRIASSMDLPEASTLSTYLPPLGRPPRDREELAFLLPGLRAALEGRLFAPADPLALAAARFAPAAGAAPLPLPLPLRSPFPLPLFPPSPFLASRASLAIATSRRSAPVLSWTA